MTPWFHEAIIFIETSVQNGLKEKITSSRKRAGTQTECPTSRE
jgi:hypothetical protein